MAIVDLVHSQQASVERVERQTTAIGRDILTEIGQGSSWLHRSWWDDRLMELTMGDPAVKVQLFRFIDVLPVLSTPESIVDHLRHYLKEAGHHVPGWLQTVVGLAPTGSIRSELLAHGAGFGAAHMARRFIAGATPTEAYKTVVKLRRKGLAFTADLLGEAVISESEADAYQATCIDLLQGLAAPLNLEPELRAIDRDINGPIPRANLSLKLTSLTAHFDALYPEVTTDRVLGRLRPILRAARDVGAFVNVDMEQYAYKDLTYSVFQKVMQETEFRDWSDVGIVAQAYLTESLSDLNRMADWVAKRGTPITIRLVKGAYWDFEVTHARQSSWPIPVYLNKWETDANYEQCSRFLLEHYETLKPAFGSHNVRSLAHALALAGSMNVPPQAYEIQMLHGMGEPIQQAMVRRGMRVRVYTPYGALLPGMAYLVRRLLENTSNESFLKASFTDHASVDILLKDPKEIGVMSGTRPKNETKPTEQTLAPFQNEPLTDFSRLHNRQAMVSTLEGVKLAFGRHYPIIIGGKTLSVRADDVQDPSTDPCQGSHVVGWTTRGKLVDAANAVRAAQEVYPSWSATPVRERAAVLIRAASILRSRRFELAAWEVYECAKPWREADADVAEAIDFCEYYSREMIRLGAIEHQDVPGETNAIERIGRGVVVVIPPWNFPLAIPTGMTVAAIVAGNAVILKPAEQSPIIAAQLVKILEEAGLPAGVLSYLPGRGEEVGQNLVDDPGVDVIAFTGSRQVGLEINRRAADPNTHQTHVKRILAEMGGKNAILIDDDADLDEAVVGVIQSAFGYAGQKCSACSRVIVLHSVYDAFVSRLTEAARAVVVGRAEDPETMVSALIDEEAQTRVLAYARTAEAQGATLIVGSMNPRGPFLGPMIFTEVSPTDRIAQEEIFGPILAVIQASELSEALAIANGTEYALTGGLYSRNPSTINQVKRDFRVGNLYINRPITGAAVARQPFGGFKLSGMGTKAGGSDYLHEFMISRTITENTMRRGFTPE